MIAYQPQIFRKHAKIRSALPWQLTTRTFICALAVNCTFFVKQRVDSFHFTPRLPVFDPVMSNSMATAFCFKDVLIRLFQLNNYPLLHDEFLKLWPEAEFARFSKYHNQHLHLTIDYCQEVKAFKVYTSYRSYDDFFRVDEDTTIIPESEFPNKFYLLYGKYLMADKFHIKNFKTDMVAKLFTKSGVRILCPEFDVKDSTLSDADKAIIETYRDYDYNSPMVPYIRSYGTL